jgi:NOL1/NOP2/fmu family ribosome biogenesis protein
VQEQKFREYLKERFGISLPDGVEFEGDKSLRVMNSELKEFKTTTPKGFPASRMKGKFPKPSTNFIQLFGNLATKNTIELNREDALNYLQGKDLKTTQEAQTGYVILSHKKSILGIGFYREGKLENMLPKGRRITPK